MLSLSRWSSPSVLGVGRLPMAPALAPYDEVDAARAGRPSPWVRSLDGRWRIRIRPRLDDVDEGDINGATTAWDPVDVPGTWVVQPAGDGHGGPIYLNVRMPFGGQPPEVPPDNPTAVYRRTFTTPPAWRRRRTHLRVGSADSMGFVWVNGTFVGLGTDSRLASTYDITAVLRRGRNDLCIVVPRWSAATWLEDQDQWWLPGLHRSVELESVPEIHLADVAMVPGLEPDGGTLDVDICVAPGDGASGLTVEVAVETMTGRRRRLLRTEPMAVAHWAPADPAAEMVLGYLWRGARVVRRLTVPGVEPWHHEAPVRYRAIVVLRDGGGAVLDVRTRPVGFRRVEVADGQLLVNGQPVVINGVNRHETHPETGRTVTVADTRRDLELMKRHHVNAVRTAHYPDDESLYDLCDELGLYVVDEANVEAHARWRSLADDPGYTGAFLARAQRMVLRDRSHPCVIAWSLDNESGDGAAHDAMAAWIRRVDPSRPLHHEGGVAFDLDAPNPTSDVVCPMYAPVERIVAWSRQRSRRRRRRPLILCEYGHAMGQAGGLDDYWAVFGVEPGLQGGFVWEWADHALRRRGPDGGSWLAYGGDFGERDHDGTFVCDGLVSADRQPHPLLEELAALARPVTVESIGGGRLRVHNRRWFRGLDDLEARWDATVRGVPAGSGVLALPPVGPQSWADVPDPSAHLDARTLTVTVRPTRPPEWADRSWVVATDQLDLGGGDEAPPVRPARPCSAADDGITLGDVAIGWPELSLWRAPTDNDDPPGAWRPAPAPAARWREWGLDRLTVESVESVEVRRRGATVRRVAHFSTPSGVVIEHRQSARVEDGAVVLVEDIRLDPALTDLPRVGVRFVLPAGFEAVRWAGLGPGTSYPDRRAAVRRGTWRSSVAEQRLPFVVPQEHGLHLDTEWLELASERETLLVRADRRFAFSALHHSAEDLTAATHAHRLAERTGTFVHLDLAHRGLGTFACGPDTHERHRVRGGRHRITWTLSAHAGP